MCVAPWWEEMKADVYQRLRGVMLAFVYCWRDNKHVVAGLSPYLSSCSPQPKYFFTTPVSCVRRINNHSVLLLQETTSAGTMPINNRKGHSPAVVPAIICEQTGREDVVSYRRSYLTSTHCTDTPGISLHSFLSSAQLWKNKPQQHKPYN